MKHEEVIAASNALDRKLTESIKELKMAGAGAGKSVREIIAEANAEVVGAVREFAELVAAQKRQHAEEIRKTGAMVVKKMVDDHEETKDAFKEMLGNEFAETEGDAAKNSA